ncbi:MAG: hypothetical protein QOF53_2802, partial [Nocardioidaceae bacterium]|nr:hypothetical protein [Nocardioidaceae bacterium]
EGARVIDVAVAAATEGDADEVADDVTGGLPSEDETAGTDDSAEGATIDEEAPTEDAPTGAGYPVEGAGTTVDDADPEES